MHNKNTITFVLSACLLTISIINWQELYLFSKIIYLPEWVKLLPSHFIASPIITILCLIPCALMTGNTTLTIKNTLLVCLLSPFTAVFFIFLTRTDSSFSVMNFIYQYLYILLMSCLIPIIVLGLINYIFNYKMAKNV